MLPHVASILADCDTAASGVDCPQFIDHIEGYEY